MGLRLLAVHAHPDDESSKGAATLAYYRARGAEAMVVSCTGGEQGSILNEALAARAHAERDIAGLRRQEMAAAQAFLGIEHVWLGYADSGMNEDGSVAPDSFAAIPLEISVAPLVRLVRRYRPHVIVAYDENGGYPHPDHIRSHEVAVAAFRDAADPERYPDLGEPWAVAKLYYDRVFSGDRMRAIRAGVAAVNPEDSRLEMFEKMLERIGDAPSLATTRVDVADFFGPRDDALRAHASQVAPDSPFFFFPHELLRAAWPSDDFQLVQSRVASTLPETDLFAGVDPDARYPLAAHAIATPVTTNPSENESV
ncbi:mycothiol conjugate amidase Mca [Microbacteriaceae bacterium VKM Ac-2855]|nr:mycothiol conjugate amidase Mca [Microbacteriaceae bacterium VKM Ac-2855]